VSAQLVIAALRHEADRGAAVVVASHDPAVVAAADTVLDLDRSG
jgi:ABC-type lipoprotein export system ATPase subunit